MTVQERIIKDVPLIPESAPFSTDQRAWLNGFFAGLLSLDSAAAAAVSPDSLPPGVAAALGGDGDDGEDPWHDPAMPLDERMKLAEGRPRKRRLYAAMAQQDCGQCGYLCEDYANLIETGEEARTNLCVPGGKETSRMLKRIMEEVSDAPRPEADAPPAAKAEDVIPGYSREAPVQAIFQDATRLTGAGSEKDTRHIVFDLAESGLAYEPGDSFGIYVTNSSDLAERVLEAMDAPPDFPIGDKTFLACLIEDYDLGLAPDMLFELASYMVGGERRLKAKALARGEDPDGDAETFDVLKVLETFGPMRPDPEAFLECLEPLQPRLYSISSSPLASPGELHLTVDVVRFAMDERERLGVASTCLAERFEPGQQVSVYIQKAHGFALPDNPETPVIMVGPGTGVAPFRSFLWERKERAMSGDAWLFFGHQREAHDFFYREEMETFVADGTLNRLSTAWSRDGEDKVYVQDRMREDGETLWSWLERGAHFYICGDAQRMARDVDAALVEIAAAQGGMSDDQAAAYVKDLKSAGRYQTDVY